MHLENRISGYTFPAKVAANRTLTSINGYPLQKREITIIEIYSFGAVTDLDGISNPQARQARGLGFNADSDRRSLKSIFLLTYRQDGEEG